MLAPRITMGGYYPLNGDTSVAQGLDISGNNRHMDNTSQVNASIVGKYNQGLHCGSVFLYKFATNSDMNIADNMTISFWTKDMQNGYPVNLKRSTSPKTLYRLIYSNSNTLTFYRNTTTVVVTYTIPATWTHIAMTYDGTTLKAFINGLLKGQTDTSGEGSQSTDYFSFMCDLALTNKGAVGDYDECIVDSRAWSEAEIKRYYSLSLGGFVPKVIN